MVKGFGLWSGYTSQASAKKRECHATAQNETILIRVGRSSIFHPAAAVLVHAVTEKVVRSYGLLGHVFTIHMRRHTVSSAGTAIDSDQPTLLFVWYEYILSFSCPYSLSLSLISHSAVVEVGLLLCRRGGLPPERMNDMPCYRW